MTQREWSYYALELDTDKWLEQIVDDLDWLARKADELACELDDPRPLSDAVRKIDEAIVAINRLRREP